MLNTLLILAALIDTHPRHIELRVTLFRHYACRADARATLPLARYDAIIRRQLIFLRRALAEKAAESFAISDIDAITDATPLRRRYFAERR